MPCLLQNPKVLIHLGAKFEEIETFGIPKIRSAIILNFIYRTETGFSLRLQATELSRFYLKTETENNLRNIVY
jgi:hypothetical protein